MERIPPSSNRRRNNSFNKSSKKGKGKENSSGSPIKVGKVETLIELYNRIIEEELGCGELNIHLLGHCIKRAIAENNISILDVTLEKLRAVKNESTHKIYVSSLIEATKDSFQTKSMVNLYILFLQNAYFQN